MHLLSFKTYISITFSRRHWEVNIIPTYTYNQIKFIFSTTPTLWYDVTQRP